ncbi:MAG: hypothetical protein FJW22_14090 [Acidimicrobiia bacterium]|nr:hypothetical protein [Acidimicrobiia bacterium]
MIRRGFAVLVCAVLLAPAPGRAGGQLGDGPWLFVGEWVLTIEGRRGPQERPLTIKDTAGKLSAELGGGRGGPIAITDVTVKGSEAILKWNQETQQGAIDVVMTLTLKDGALTVKQDMAGGQFSQTGTGKKKG